jgi:tetratricopeptide (TPR) repeat protein
MSGRGLRQTMGAVCLIGLLFLVPSLSGAPRQDHRDYLFQQGSGLYQKGEYEKALDSYGGILTMGYESAEVYYNMGNCYFKLGRNARAILYYERALRLRPRDEDIRYNLQMANLAVTDKIQAIPELFHVRAFKRLRSLMSLRVLTIFALILYFLTAAWAVFWMLARSRILRRVSRAAFLICLAFLILSSLTLVSKILSGSRNVEAVVQAGEVTVRSAPRDEATEIFTIHEGLKVRISDRREGWYEIRLADGNEGWLPAGDVEII